MSGAKIQLQLFGEDSSRNGCVSKKTLPDAGVVSLSAKSRPRNLWVCIFFPHLCLESLGFSQLRPGAAFIEQRGVPAVFACNAGALKAGVTPGMSLSAALALSPELDIRQRRESAEQTMLQARASWALKYTPVVSIDSTGALLLEVGGSLRLFGGLAPLRERLLSDLRVSGHQVVVASAPTTKAARWLAKSGRNVDGNTVHELPGLLANLPLGCLDWPVNVQQQLLQMGIRTLGECRRLPRDGFARRIGPGYLLELDQGFGACPDLMLKHHEPETFDDEIDLVSESRATTEIIGALTELLERLSASLSCRQVSVEHLSVCMSHCGKAPTYLELSLREPSAATDYFMELLQLQLDRQVLPAPVTNIAVRARFTQTYQVATADLLSTALHGDASISLPGIGVAHDDAPGLAAARLVERLRTRLGMQHVYGLELVAEHRPERAWRVREPLSGHASQSGKVEFVSRRRPLWLLAKPRRLNCQQDKPLFRGELLISDNAERIESGWWDGNDVRRDYYMASGHTGCRYWIYRDRRSARWYLHGLFG